MTAPRLQRHSMVYCAQARMDDVVLAGAADDIAVASSWTAAGRPLIARMRRDDDPADGLSLGLPLPLNQGKKRIALSLHPSAVARIEAPPRLDAAIGILPAAWQERLSKLSGRLHPHVESVHVIGSAAWQFLVALPYLHPRSDIDLVLRVKDSASLQAALDCLSESDRTAGPRIDGEIVSQDGEAVAWRELCKPSKEVLVKTLNGPRAVLRHEWLRKFEARAA